MFVVKFAIFFYRGDVLAMGTVSHSTDHKSFEGKFKFLLSFFISLLNAMKMAHIDYLKGLLCRRFFSRDNFLQTNW